MRSCLPPLEGAPRVKLAARTSILGGRLSAPPGFGQRSCFLIGPQRFEHFPLFQCLSSRCHLIHGPLTKAISRLPVGSKSRTQKRPDGSLVLKHLFQNLLDTLR